MPRLETTINNRKYIGEREADGTITWVPKNKVKISEAERKNKRKNPTNSEENPPNSAPANSTDDEDSYTTSRILKKTFLQLNDFSIKVGKDERIYTGHENGKQFHYIIQDGNKIHVKAAQEIQGQLRWFLDTGEFAGTAPIIEKKKDGKTVRYTEELDERTNKIKKRFIMSSNEISRLLKYNQGSYELADGTQAPDQSKASISFHGTSFSIDIFYKNADGHVVKAKGKLIDSYINPEIQRVNENDNSDKPAVASTTTMTTTATTAVTSTTSATMTESNVPDEECQDYEDNENLISSTEPFKEDQAYRYVDDLTKVVVDNLKIIAKEVQYIDTAKRIANGKEVITNYKKRKWIHVVIDEQGIEHEVKRPDEIKGDFLWFMDTGELAEAYKQEKIIEHIGKHRVNYINFIDPITGEARKRDVCTGNAIKMHLYKQHYELQSGAPLPAHHEAKVCYEGANFCIDIYIKNLDGKVEKHPGRIKLPNYQIQRQDKVSVDVDDNINSSGEEGEIMAEAAVSQPTENVPATPVINVQDAPRPSSSYSQQSHTFANNSSSFFEPKKPRYGSSITVPANLLKTLPPSVFRQYFKEPEVGEGHLPKEFLQNNNSSRKR